MEVQPPSEFTFVDQEGAKRDLFYIIASKAILKLDDVSQDIMNENVYDYQ